MSVSQPKKKKGKAQGDELVPSGMLDAYTDSGNNKKKSKYDSKPVSTKNKNKKKLEQRLIAEEEAKVKAENEIKVSGAVIDSWEDLEPDFVPSNPIGPSDTKEASLAPGKSHKAEALGGKPVKEGGNEVKKQPLRVESPNTPAKSKEEIMAEREAKKAAKAARRAAVKANNNDDPSAAEVGVPEENVQNPPAAKDSFKPKDAGGKPQKSKSELKAERRAKQEAERMAKLAAKVAPPAQEKVEVNKLMEFTKKPAKKKVVSAEVSPIKSSSNKKVMLFSHLHTYEREPDFGHNLPLVFGEVHPAIVQLGLQYAGGTISGSNSRCVALMHALKRVIRDYVTPPQKELCRDLDASLKPYISFLNQFRTLSVSMENALKHVRSKIRLTDHSISDEDAKSALIEDIDEFVHVNIVLASKQISLTAREKIKNGDVIFTYGHSSLVRNVLVDAAESGIVFRVIVADSKPKSAGKEMIRHLVKAGIKCTYVLISVTPYVIREVSKVIVGASSVLANGTVNARVGTSQIALIAKAANVPVLVCCETYKFSERVQTDSFVFNELGDPNDLVSPGDTLSNWRNVNKLNLLNLNYDITPARLVDAIISEISVIPGTSVPVVLRLKNSLN